VDAEGRARAMGDKDLLQTWSGEIGHNTLVTADIECEEETWLIVSSAIAAWGGEDSVHLRELNSTKCVL